MYCAKCGNLINDGQNFCQSCGNSVATPQVVPSNQQNTDNKKYNVSFYMSVLTTPLMVVMRLLMQVKADVLERGFCSGFPHTDQYLLPNNIKVVMFIILVVSIVAALELLLKSKKLKGKQMLTIIILNIINGFLGYTIITAE